jgi:hypothetical protein
MPPPGALRAQVAHTPKVAGMTPQHSDGRVTIRYQWHGLVDLFSAALIDVVVTLICFFTCEGTSGRR